jgi:hypothetical protein
MIRTRRALLFCSLLVVAIAATGGGWIVGAVIIGWYLALAPGSAACRVLRVSRERPTGWITVVALSFSIDVVCSEAMVYMHVWTPLRAIVVIAVLTSLLVAVEYRTARTRNARTSS